MVKEVKEPRSTRPIYKKQSLGKYLGYRVYIEYAIEYIGGRWNLSYRVIEDFSPFFSSSDHGAISISGSKSIRSYKRRLDAVRAMESYMGHVTMEDVIREF